MAAVDCLMKCVISAHIHSIHVEPSLLQHQTCVLAALTTYTCICIRTSHGLLNCLVNNLFLTWIVHTYCCTCIRIRTSHGLLYCLVNNVFLIISTHLLFVMPCIIYTHVLVPYHIQLCVHMYMQPHTPVH